MTVFGTEMQLAGGMVQKYESTLFGFALEAFRQLVPARSIFGLVRLRIEELSNLRHCRQ